MLPNERMHIGEIFVTGCGRPRIFGATRRGMCGLLLPVEHRLGGLARLRLWLGWRGLFGWRRRYNRRGLLRWLGRRWLDLHRRGRWGLGFFGWRLFCFLGRRRRSLLRGRRVIWLATGLLRLGVAQVLGSDATWRRRFELRFWRSGLRRRWRGWFEHQLHGDR